MKTIRELIKVLQTLPPDLIVGLASDEEGNSVNVWSGDIGLASYDEYQDRGDRFRTYLYDEDGEELVPEVAVDRKHATGVILWP